MRHDDSLSIPRHPQTLDMQDLSLHSQRKSVRRREFEHCAIDLTHPKAPTAPIYHLLEFIAYPGKASKLCQPKPQPAATSSSRKKFCMTSVVIANQPCSKQIEFSTEKFKTFGQDQLPGDPSLSHKKYEGLDSGPKADSRQVIDRQPIIHNSIFNDQLSQKGITLKEILPFDLKQLDNCSQSAAKR